MSVIGENATGEVRLIAGRGRRHLRLDVFARTFELFDPTATRQSSFVEGADVTAGQTLAAYAPTRALLSARAGGAQSIR